MTTESHPTLLPHANESSADAVKEQLARILASDNFKSSKQRRALLVFLVTETLEGRGDHLKGVSLAMSVFGRDEHFDQQSDPIVRIEARRLRNELDGYYASQGRDDVIRISIPKGGYIVHFNKQNSAGNSQGYGRNGLTSGGAGISRLLPADSFLSRRGLAVVAAVALALVIGSVWYWRSSPQVPDRLVAAEQLIPVIVLPFHAMDDTSVTGYLAEGITREVISDLMQFSGLRLYAKNASFRLESASDPLVLRQEFGITYVVRGSVSTTAGNLHVSADLIAAKDERVLWSKSFDRPLSTKTIQATQDELATEIASVLGQTFGPIKSDFVNRSGALAQPNMDSYLCVLHALSYRRTFDTKMHEEAHACLLATVKADPAYADAWAMLGWIHLDDVRFGLVPETEASSTLDEALREARHAVSLDHTNLSGLQALGSILFYSGRFDEAEQVMRTALAINPNDPETLIQYGWRLAVRGKWDEGIPMVQMAIARTIDPPGWYYDTVSAHQYLTGDYAGATASAKKSADDGSGIGWSIVAMSEAALGNEDAAQDALARMGEFSPEMIVDPAAVYRTHHLVESAVVSLVQGLRQAGWKGP